MALSTSDILAFAALLVSTASAYYTKGQRDLNKFMAETGYRGQLAASHEKYRAALKEVCSKHEAGIRDLSSLAGATLNKITNIFDEFDQAPRPRYLRHLLHECSEMVFCSFKGQLGWQSGLNIAHRIFQFTNVEDRLEPLHHYFSQDAFREAMASEYFKNKNIRQEQHLLEDVYFAQLLEGLKKRLANADGAELLRRILAAMEPFEVHFQGLQPEFATSAKFIKKLLEEGEGEEFPLKQSFDLWCRLDCQQATLESLSCIVIPRINPQDAELYNNSLSLSIYFCALLHAVQEFHTWGWQEYRANP